jgi:hypothetical protein
MTIDTEQDDAQSIFTNGNQSLDDSHIDDLRKAALKMKGAERRAFQAEMALKYCQGVPRQAEKLFGWSRNSVEFERAQSLLR